jgi:hypothetical protein
MRDVLATFEAAGLISDYRAEPIQSEWARWGLDAAAAAKSRPRPARPDPEKGGLFAPHEVGVTGRQRGYR